MTKQLTKPQLLKDIQAERRRLEHLLSNLEPEQMILPGVVGTWSVKDVLAHLVAWEQLLLGWYRAGLQNAGSATQPVGMSRKAMDALNTEIHAANCQRSLDDILGSFHSSYQEVLTVIEAIPEVEMFAHGRYTWTGRLTLADYIAGNTCNHYAWARDSIRKHFAVTAGQPGM
jgi:hypothetical protein